MSKNIKYTSHTIIQKLPEIVIVSFNNYPKTIINYYVSFEIKNVYQIFIKILLSIFFNNIKEKF